MRRNTSTVHSDIAAALERIQQRNSSKAIPRTQLEYKVKTRKEIIKEAYSAISYGHSLLAKKNEYSD